MELINISFIFLFVLLFFDDLIVKRYHSAPIIKHPNLDPGHFFPPADKFVSVIDQTKDIVGRFRCLQGWKQFGGSCYHPSIVQSIPGEANYTCSLLRVNNTQLMRIRNAVELSYAAHIVITNNLTTLLLEIDPRLFKGKRFTTIISASDQTEWQKIEDRFHQARLQYKQKTKISDTLERKKKNDDDQKENIYSSDDDNDAVESFDHIRDLCNQFTWNVTNNDSHIFTFTAKKILDKVICSLSDVDPYSVYEHVCQYVLDVCIGNFMCSEHGKCINTFEGFKCSCSFFFNGILCDVFSHQKLQIGIGLFILIILLSLYQISKRKFFKSSSDQQPTTANDKQQDHISDSTDYSTDSDDESETKSWVRLLPNGFLAWILFCLLIAIPTSFHLNSFPFANYDHLEPETVINEVVSIITKCENKSIFRLDDLIVSGISIGLIIIFFLIPKGKPCRIKINCVSDFPTPIKPFRKTNRFETAAIFGILTFEVLKVFDEILIATRESSDRGVLVKFAERIFVLMLIGSRYYPTLASLHIKNPVIRFLASLHILGIIAHFIIRESLCINFLPHSDNFSALDEAYLRLNLGTRFIIYGLITNVPHFVLLSYIGAELTLRFIYDSICGYDKKKRTEQTKISHLEQSIQSRGISTGDIENNDDSNEEDNRSRVRKFFDRIYRSDEEFSYATMIICTYTISFIILFHLTCTFIFLYTTRLMSPIALLKQFLEWMFNIEMTNWFFNKEITFSAILTAIGYGIQLFFGIKSFKKHMMECHVEDLDAQLIARGIKEESDRRSKATQYPGYLIRYTIGGFVISFHLVIFITILCRLILFNYSAVQPILAIILPILILYGLQSLLTRWTGRLVTVDRVDHNSSSRSRSTGSHHSEHGHSWENIQHYVILVANCFIGIASSIFLLLKGLLFNIICMNRIDFSHLGGSFEKYDNANSAYLCFLYLELRGPQPNQQDLPKKMPIESLQSLNQQKEADQDDVSVVISETRIAAVTQEQRQALDSQSIDERYVPDEIIDVPDQVNTPLMQSPSRLSRNEQERHSTEPLIRTKKNDSSSASRSRPGVPQRTSRSPTRLQHNNNMEMAPMESPAEDEPLSLPVRRKARRVTAVSNIATQPDDD